MIAVTTGIAGLAMWCAVVRKAILDALVKMRRRPDTEKELYAGSVAGLIGGATALLFCPFAFQPIVVYWIFIAAMMDTQSADRRPS